MKKLAAAFLLATATFTGGSLPNAYADRDILSSSDDPPGWRNSDDHGYAINKDAPPPSDAPPGWENSDDRGYKIKKGPEIVVVPSEGTIEASSDINADGMISYGVDTRTGMCFAMTRNGTSFNPSIANLINIPCSKEVLSLVPKGKRDKYIKKYGAPK